MSLFRQLRIFLLATASLLVLACQGEKLPDNLSVSTRSQAGLAKGGYTFVEVKATARWTLQIDFAGAEPWATLTQTSGSGENNGVILSYEANEGDSQRSLTLILSNGEDQASCSFVQLTDSGAGAIVQDPVCNWMELPATDNPALYFFTHYASSSKVRNYSYYWDVENLVAHWVAYPLNSGLVGSGSRTDDWGLDPKLPRNLQPVLDKGFRGGYDRGHQLPSADRLARAANIQTFYGTNMTPQKGSLNQNGWASLEGAVRDWSYKFDTLYVVTGCTVKGSTAVAYDNDNKAVTVPTGYFKALLGYQKTPTIGITPTTNGYTAIGFYYPHEGYSGSYMAKSMTIDALEEKVGIDFFVNLPSTIGETLADKVESAIDPWWK